MKKLILIPFLFLALFVKGQSKETLRKIEAAKIALITERLNLTPEQAERFWPIYREYSTRNKEIRRDFDQARRKFDPNRATEDENKRMLEMGSRVKERQLDLEKEYSQRILQVITNRQLNNLRAAERDFREMLLRRIKAQRLRQQQRDRNDTRLRDRRN